MTNRFNHDLYAYDGITFLPGNRAATLKSERLDFVRTRNFLLEVHSSKANFRSLVDLVKYQILVDSFPFRQRRS